MANAKISALTATTGLTGAEQVPVVQGGTTKRTTVQDVVALAVASVPTPGIPNDVGSGTYLVSGGSIGWDSALIYRVGAAVYYVNGVACTSAEQTVTLSVADGSNPRIDVLKLDAAGTLSATAGTPAADPAESTIDPELYLRLGIILVGANLLAPTTTQQSLYAEDAGGSEWVAAASVGTIVKDSTNNPRTDTKCIEGTAVAANAYITFTKPAAATQDLATENNLVFFVEVKSAWPSTKTMRLRWYSGTAARGSNVTISNGLYGFNSATTGDYQQISVPISAFNMPAGNLVTNLRLTIVGGGATVGFYIDDIVLNSGATTIPSLTASRALVSNVSGDVAVSLVTAAELSILDGVTATAAELNYLDISSLGTGAASKAVVLNSSGDYSFPATTNITAASGADFTFASGTTVDIAGTFEIANVAVTATAAELNKLAGTPAGLTSTELGYCDGVTSAIQTQLDTKGPTTVGLHSIPIMAGSMTPRVNQPCASLATVAGTTGRPDKTTLDFATGADEFAHFSICMPSSWNEGTVTFTPYWSNASGTGTVCWALAGIAVGNDDVIDTAFGTPQTSTDDVIAAGDMHIGATSGAITIAGTPAAGDIVFFEISRDVSADTLAVDARLHGILLHITTQTAVDA